MDGTVEGLAIIKFCGRKFQTKTKPMAWFVSNCNAPSGRQKYVEQLKKYVSVDVYGMLWTTVGQQGTVT